MVKEINVTIKAQDEKNDSLIQRLCFDQLFKSGIKAKKDEIKFVFAKKSIDARHGQLKLNLKFKAYIGEEPKDDYQRLPQWKKADGNKNVLIIGSGPAGLFAALKLLEKGIKPVIIERGEETQKRRKDIAKISTQYFVNSDSNYCFGEGGAGAFSDGKLYTRSNKRGDISKILSIFANFGADPKILTDAHPHIGTNKLPAVINAMKNKIVELGGEIRFNLRCTDFILENSPDDSKRIAGVKCNNVFTGEEFSFYADAVILATGHSAFDIYELLGKTSPESLEAKTFAMGVRVEHPRELIDSIQYRGKTGQENLGAAEYRLTTQVEDRGVFSFCMCPGGFVVPSASMDDEIVVNGMSCAERNSRWSNAAIVVQTLPEDIPEEYVQMAKAAGCKELAGLYFRKSIEKMTKQNGKGQAAPAQRLTDFLAERSSKDFPKTSYTPGIVSSRLDVWLPKQIASRLSQAFKNFDRMMHGFITKDAILIASETRTSTPVRILRDKESFECVGIKKLYPCGEGSGYSGGIVSSAMDGENAAAAIIGKFLK